MATITGATNEKVYSISKWLGLNEHPDGDTNLRMGEAAVMENWKITRDGNLKRRPGLEFFAGLSEAYEIHISDDVVMIASGLKATDKVPVFASATAMAPPGTVTLVGMSGVVENGRYTIGAAGVTGGTLEGRDDLTFTVENGRAHPTGISDLVTVAELAELLAELDEGEWLYTRIDEMPYGLRNDSLEPTNGTYTLNGYQMSAVVDGSTAKPVAGLWSGIAGGKQTLLAACDGKLWSLWDAENGVVSRSGIGSINTDNGVNFIPFDNKVYIQNGKEYYVWDGLALNTVTGYVPLVAVSIGPQGGVDSGELTAEYVNLLINKRRVWLSPDGTNKTFRLPEEAASIVSVTDLGTGTAITAYSFTADTTDITFTNAPASAVNSIEVQYSVHAYTVPKGTTYYSDSGLTTSVGTTSDDYPGDYYTSDDDVAIAFKISSTTYYAKVSDCTTLRSQVTAMRFCEIFSGGTDQALFFYGDGSNKTLYTGMDYDGMPRPDYFPDQYEARVGDANTPITSMIRHYSVLMAYKPEEAWALSYGTTELATGDLTTAVYVTPVNRDKGNAAPGQVRLVNNNPVTCSGSELYQWTNSSYYTSNLTRDERQAKRISDRIQKSIKEIDFEHCCMWDDNDGQEFYISGNGVTLVWNYVTDTWYRYSGLDAVIMCNFQGDVILGTSGGKIFRLTYLRDTDDGVPIMAEWESGSMDFGASNMRKFSSMMWVSLKPEHGTSVDVTVITDRKNTFKDKVVSSEKAKIPGQPFATRAKIKAKKFVFYKLLLNIDRKMPATTVTNVDFRVRQTGYSK